jgi:polyprenyl P-hydroxybenzoate/phenylacrylic acid decarboxylase-like protein
MRIIVAITGATGAVYGVRLLDALRELQIETHLVLSRWAEVTLVKETGLSAREFASTASVVYSRDNLGAPIASGSFRHDGMIIAPCSMKTLAAIRHGYAHELIVRAADVTLKERRRLVLLTRETPLSDIHLENMLALSRMGAIIAPPVPAFYCNPRTIDDLVDHTIGRVLDLFGLELPTLKRWNGLHQANELPSLSADARIISGGGKK